MRRGCTAAWLSAGAGRRVGAAPDEGDSEDEHEHEHENENEHEHETEHETETETETETEYEIDIGNDCSGNSNDRTSFVLPLAGAVKGRRPFAVGAPRAPTAGMHF